MKSFVVYSPWFGMFPKLFFFFMYRSFSKIGGLFFYHLKNFRNSGVLCWNVWHATVTGFIFTGRRSFLSCDFALLVPHRWNDVFVVLWDECSEFLCPKFSLKRRLAKLYHYWLLILLYNPTIQNWEQGKLGSLKTPEVWLGA